MIKRKNVITVLLMLLVFVLPAFADEIHDAALKGDFDTVKALLKNDPGLLNAKGGNDKTPIHWAAQGGHKEIVAFLLEQGAPVESRNIVDETPLIYAADRGHKELAEFLLARGADLNAESKRGDKAINYAIWGGFMDLAKLLIEKGASVQDKKENGWTLLHDVAWEGKKEMIMLLIKKGIPADAKTDFGRTPLHNACIQGNLEGAQVLIAAGADVNSRSEEDWWPLYMAVKRGHKDVAALLISSGATVDMRDKNDRSPLHIAALNGYGEIADLLLSKGADANAKDSKEKTPLQYACRYRHKKTANVLLAKGANKEDLKKNFDPSKLLQKELQAGDALIWYTGHSGWAIKTQNHFLIFDYFKNGPLPDTPNLTNGNIITEEIKGLNVAVFTSHDHGDHYMPAIFDWQKDIPNITYIMGFKPKDRDNGYIYIGPREKKEIDGMKVVTIESNDSGVAFFVLVDGVKIFHSGDHANRKQDFSGPFAGEIDFLAKKGLKPDIFFAPVSGCGFGDLEAVKKGVYYTIKKLSPRSLFPMHAGGGEERYLTFAKEARKAGFDVPMCCAENSGDIFFVGQKGIKGALPAEGKGRPSEKGESCRKEKKKF